MHCVQQGFPRRKLGHCKIGQTPELSHLQSHSQPEEEEAEEEEAAEELGHAETYADYVPSKCKCLRQGQDGDALPSSAVTGVGWTAGILPLLPCCLLCANPCPLTS